MSSADEAPDLRAYRRERMDPRATLERLLAPEVLSALDAYVRELATDIAMQTLAGAQFAGGRAWVSVAEAAELLACTPNAVRSRHKRGRLAGRYQGRRLYISTESILNLRSYSAEPTDQKVVAPARRGRRPGP